MPIDHKLIGKIAKRGGGRLIDQTVSRLLPEAGSKASLGGKLVGAALVRIASRSVPGAILVGGGLLARALHKKRQEARAAKAVDIITHKPG